MNTSTTVHENVGPSNANYLAQAQNQARLALELVAKYKEAFEDLFGSANKIGAKPLWQSWQNEVRTSFWIAYCNLNVFLGVIEFGVSWPIWEELLPDFPWLGALGMVLIGALISHGYAKLLSEELNIWQLNELLRARPEVSFDEVKKGHQKDRFQDAAISTVILVFAAWFIYYLTDLRVQLEGRPWLILDWAPVGLFVLNSTLLGIYWQWFFRRIVLKRKIKNLESKLEHLNTAINYHLDLFITNLTKAEESNTKLLITSEMREAKFLYLNRVTSEIEMPISASEWSGVFVFEGDNGTEVNDEPFIVKFSNGFESDILNTGNGFQKLSFSLPKTEVCTSINFLRLKRNVEGYYEGGQTHYISLDSENKEQIITVAS